MAPLTSPCLAKATLIAVVVLLAPTPALAHGDFDARVASLSAQIQEQPSAAR
jgi:hypothetical protein